MKLPSTPFTPYIPFLPLVALLVTACGSPPPATSTAQPQSCAAAAASVAANNPVRGTTVRITKAEDQAATPTAKAHCLVEGAMNERISAVDGRPYAIKFRSACLSGRTGTESSSCKAWVAPTALWTPVTACFPA